MKTAYINLEDKGIRVFASFLKQLESAGMPADRALPGLLTHEAGHYVVHPHDLAAQIYLMSEADTHFGELGKQIFAVYTDGAVNLDCFRSDVRGPMLADVYRSTVNLTRSALHRIMGGFYQEQTKTDLGITLDEEERKIAAKLKEIDFTQRWDREYAHAINMILFGQNIADVLKDSPKSMTHSVAVTPEDINRYKATIKTSWSKVLASYAYPLLPDPVMIEYEENENSQCDSREDGEQAASARQKTSASKSKGNKKGRAEKSDSQCDSGQEKNEGSRNQSTNKNSKAEKSDSQCCSSGELSEYTDDQLNSALDRVAQRHDVHEYRKAEEMIKRNRKDFKNNYTPEEDNDKQAGTGGDDEIQLNDKLVPYYARKAAGFGLYISKRHVKGQEEDIPEQVIFETGDDVTRINPYSSRGILPGITSRRELTSEPKGRGYDDGVADLFAFLDTSGSMRHPSLDSVAVLSMFILGRNYHANGSRIGLGNFSREMLLVPPTRELEEYYRAACAYWGGGTVLDVGRIKMAMSQMGKQLDDETIGNPELRRNIMSENGLREEDFQKKHVGIDLGYLFSSL